MKILIITNKIPYPPKDGGSIATLNLAKGLAHFAESVTILTINTSKHFYDLEKIPKDLKEKIYFEDVYIDTTTKPVPALKNLLFSKVPYNAERFISQDFEEKIISNLNKNKYDIIQLEGLYLTPYIPTIRKHSKALISLRAHNVEHEIWQRTTAQESNFLKKKYIQNLTKRIKNMETSMLNKYDLLVPITVRDEKILNKLGNTKPSHTTPTGYEIEKLTKINTKSIKQEFPSIFHLGALDWSPNQEGISWFLNNCWTKINEQFPDLKFYIAGRNAPEWFIKKLNKKNVVYCGEVDDATEFILSKAIMLVPLLSGSGMRIKIIEGMALQKTIVTTSIGAEGIPASHKNNILIANKPEDFTSEIITVLKDEELYNKIGKNAKDFISKNFDNLTISKSLIDFYILQKAKF